MISEVSESTWVDVVVVFDVLLLQDPRLIEIKKQHTSKKVLKVI